MRYILAAAIANLLAIPAACQGWTNGRTYRCTATSTFELANHANPDGHFRSTTINRSFTYDEGSGRLHWAGDRISWEFETIQKGDTERAMKAVRILPASGTNVLETLHIATWEAPSVGVTRNGVFPFLYNSDATVYGGICTLD